MDPLSPFLANSCETLFTTNAQVEAATEHAMQYDGATELIADDTIVLNADKTMDKAKSFVTFESVNWTYNGTLVVERPPRFKTVAVPIIEATLNADDSVASFVFSGTDWYPPTATGAARLRSLLLAGRIDLGTGGAEYVASYSTRSNGAIYDYDVTGTIRAPAPEPVDGARCGDLAGCAAFLAPPAEVAEPPLWALLVAAFASAAWVRCVATRRSRLTRQRPAP